MLSRPYLILATLLLTGASLFAQSEAQARGFAPLRDTSASMDIPAYSPAPMGRERALEVMKQRSANQSASLAGYTAKTSIKADLPDSSQHAQLDLTRSYTAPDGLQFKAVQSSGDHFVKTNVITRLLQAEVTHVQKDTPADTALNEHNYKFEYRGTDLLNGTPVHAFSVRPRRKAPGLFAGFIYLDAATGELLRSQGTFVKTPSLFIKKISFVEDFATVEGFTLPVHLHSEASTRLVGKVVVEMDTNDYKPVSREQLAQSQAELGDQ